MTQTQQIATTSSDPTTPGARLLAAAKRNDWAEFESLWMELPTLGPRPDADVRAVALEVRKRRGEQELLGFVELLLEQDFPPAHRPAALRWALACLDLVGPAEGVRERLAAFATAAIEPAADGEALVRACGLDGATPVDKAARTLASLLDMRPGAVFAHKFYGSGIIVAVDYDAQRLTMDFPGSAHARIPVKFDHLKELLTPFPPGHYEVMRLARPDDVKHLAAEDPGRLVRLIAAARGGKASQAELKTALTANVMTDAEFKAWWGKRRADVVRDPLLNVEGKGAHCTFVLRDDEKAYHEEVVRAFNAAKTFPERLDAVRDVLRMARDGAFPPEAFDALLNPFRTARLGADKLSPSERIAWEMTAQLLLSVAPAGFEIPYACDVVAELKAAARPVETIAALEIPEFVVGCFRDLKEAHPADWPRLLHDLGELTRPRVTQRVVDELLATGHGDVASDMLGRIVSFPERNPDTYLWTMGGLLDGTLGDVSVGLDRHHLIEDLLTELESLERPVPSVTKAEEKERRALALGIMKLLGERQHHHVARMLLEMDTAGARAFYQGLEKRRLDESFIGQLRHSLRKTRNDLEEERGADPSEFLDQVIMCTEASMERKMAEFRQLKTVDIPANSKAIGAAAELGDLRENSEYQTAKDHQKVLFRRLEELDMQLHRARVITPDRVSTDAIDFGTRFVTRADDGDERAFVMMGPWESDPDHGVISYQAPLGKAFYKKKIGDAVAIERPGGGTRQVTVVKIEKAPF